MYDKSLDKEEENESRTILTILWRTTIGFISNYSDRLSLVLRRGDVVGAGQADSLAGGGQVQVEVPP